MVAITSMVSYEVLDNTAVLSINNPPVNALSQGVRQGLLEGMAQATSDEAATAIVIHCEGRTFIAGADITEFASGPAEPGLHEVLIAMEASAKPVVAAIHGTALGGGLETALCCHYRVSDAGAKFGLPEVNLGLLPGAGGTQRLPRLVGAQKALEMMTSGKPVGAEEALALGLADEVCSGDLRSAAIAFAQRKAAGNSSHPKVRDRNEKMLEAREQPELFTAFREKIARKTRGYLAPEYNIRCIEAAVNLPFDEGMQIESKLFSELMSGPQSAAQQYFFFAERQAAKIPGIDRDLAERPIHKVGIIGAGTMGGGIAMNMANVGIPVTLIEIKQESLDRGLAVIRKNYENTAKKGRISAADVETCCGLITGSLDMGDLADCDLVIEAVFENMKVKQSIFRDLDSITKPEAILASNTSALDLNEIASVTKRPQSVIGLHFFSPANVMKLLEVVRGEHTSPDVIKTCMSLAKRIRKVAVLVGVCHGFVGNRILFARQAQAQKLALEGAAVHEIDKALYDFGMPMGAFQMADLAGLDIGWSKETSKGETVKDRLCEMGRLGQKSGSGYYDYDEKRQPTPNAEVHALFEEYAQRGGVTRRSISEEEILERCLLPMVNEGAKILHEGIALRASDIDVVYVYGYGWPNYRGGPMHYANTMGLSNVVEKLQHYHAETGDELFKPSEYLVQLAKEGKSF